MVNRVVVSPTPGETMKARIITLGKVGRPRTKLPMHFLHALREEGLTIRQISDRTEIPHSTVGAALRGKFTPRQRKRRALKSKTKGSSNVGSSKV